ncbi:polysaccharide pyruvyl transferase family protein [Sphingomonas sp. Mn802worker]|uniref:polysaccharide pyruvyl transferase family protein n=1 Tax=Sphingomonas sp. Mn802worker TaxID=629773 RepID=UPI0003635509|nr:polysaccharide pyruvyl transferase family protein [Sphingomonas sp. Mn802worker]
MQLFYYKDVRGNFGDDLNSWLWDRLNPGLIDDRSDELLVGIGTILAMAFPDASVRKYVVGSGTGLGTAPRVDASWRFLAVRGPLTARVLDLPASVPQGDAAMLLHRLPEYQSARVPNGRVAFIPHISSSRRTDWRRVCALAGIDYIDPEHDSVRVIAQIRGCSLLIAEAMHGAIVADTLGVPWIPVRSSDEINDFKWNDWALSLGMKIGLNRIRPASLRSRVRDVYWPLTGWNGNQPIDAATDMAMRMQVLEQAMLSNSRKGAVARLVERGFQGTWRRAIEPAVDTLAGTTWSARYDERAATAAADDLTDIARLEPQLSSRSALQDRIGDLEDALHRLRTRAA